MGGVADEGLELAALLTVVVDRGEAELAVAAALGKGRDSMLWALRAMVFTGYFALAVLVVLGVADLVAKKWTRAVGELFASGAGFAAGMVLLREAGSLFAGAYENPDDQFRLLTVVASTMMNWSVTGFAVGGIAGTLLAMRRRRAEEAQ